MAAVRLALRHSPLSCALPGYPMIRCASLLPSLPARSLPLAPAHRLHLRSRRPAHRSPSREETAVHIDLDHPRIAGPADEGIRAFDEDGRPTDYLQAVMAGLDELDQGHRGNADFFTALERYDLLEPFSLDIELRDGSKHRLVGYHLIDEEKLRALEAGAIAELHAAGYLMPVFMALASLSNISSLVVRKNRKLGLG